MNASAIARALFVVLVSAGYAARGEDPAPTSVILFKKGDPVPSAGIDPEGAPAGARFSRFGIPAINEAGQVAFLGKWSSPSGRGAAIFVNGSIWVRAGFVTGLPPGTTWKNFKDPLIAPSGDVLFLGTITGDGVTPANDTVLASSMVVANLGILAREGGQPPDAPLGAQWRSFDSLVVGGLGSSPLFLASLVIGPGGVSAENDTGVWAVTTTGSTRTLRKVVGEGDLVLGKTLRSIAALRAVSGSPAATRAVNFNAQFVYRATFDDGSSAIVTVALP